MCLWRGVGRLSYHPDMGIAQTLTTDEQIELLGGEIEKLDKQEAAPFTMAKEIVQSLHEQGYEIVKVR